MTWLVGSTTWANVVNDLTKLICAEMTDSLGHAPTAGEKWVRDISTSYNVLRMPAAQDVDLAAVHQPAMRCGYWTITGSNQPGSGTPAPSPGATGMQTSIIQTAAFTGPWAGASQGRWSMTLTCTTSNTVPGNYSTAQFTISAQDFDSTGSFYNYYYQPNAAGVLTLPIGTGGQVTVSDPSGIFPVGVQFTRSFTLTYMWGADYWPMYSRRSGTWTFATAPPGAAGTDYDIIDQVGPNSVGLSGLGIRTATGYGSGARYVFSACPCTQLKAQMIRNQTSGAIDLLVGGQTLDAVNGNVVRANAGWLAGSGSPPHFVVLATTPANLITTATVQYWMSVTATGIVIALNTDPGYTGIMANAYFGLMTPGTAYDTNDKFRNFISPGSTDLSYFRQFRCQDGSHGSRDWQTYWMRNDFNLSNNAFYTLGTYQPLYIADQYLGSSFPYDASPVDSQKPNFDGNWWMYGHNVTENYATGTTGSTSPLNEQIGFPRGALNDRFWHLPDIGWSNGDELTDTNTSAKYFLTKADPAGSNLPGRLSVYSGGSYIYRGGTAIAEI